ncbi:MAG TPA: NADH-quinone oxidoreductase subunit N [Ignavibacteriaceae bacterium]|nr:NADH-quinone oxidoreductase subunit N [Ignavibacteriaceae bacterium]
MNTISLEYLVDSLKLIKPEIAVTITLVLLVLVDLIMNKNKKFLPYIFIGGLVVAIYFILAQYSTSSFAFNISKNLGMVIVDPFGNFFKILISGASIIVILFSILSNEIKEGADRQGEYYVLIAGMILGMFFMVSSADLILIYVSVELLSLSSYILAGFTKQAIRNSEASLKYVIYGGISSGIMLFGISILYGLTGSTNLYEINSLVQASQVHGFTFVLAGFLIFVGIGFKISAAPFHFWTPDVYEGAPIPITAYLSIASKAAGFALLIRFIKITFIQSIDPNGFWHLLNIIDWKTFIIIISILTMTLGNFAAIWQNNMKRLLAYSSIAHAGYLLLGLAVLSNEGIAAILIYFVIYGFMNLGAFLVVMLISNKLGSEEIDDYDGLGSKAPFLSVSLAIFLVSLTGLPPTAGFIGKLYIFLALVDAKMIVVAVIALLNTVVSLYYYVRVLKHMFLSDSKKETPAFTTSIASIVFLVIMLTPVLIFGIYFTPLVDFAKSSIALMGF